MPIQDLGFEITNNYCFVPPKRVCDLLGSPSFVKKSLLELVSACRFPSSRSHQVSQTDVNLRLTSVIGQGLFRIIDWLTAEDEAWERLDRILDGRLQLRDPVIYYS